MNSCLIQFVDDGHKVVTSRNALGRPADFERIDSVIKLGAIRITHKPDLAYPFVIQVQTTKDKWVFLDSYPTRARAERALERLKRKGHRTP